MISHEFVQMNKNDSRQLEVAKQLWIRYHDELMTKKKTQVDKSFIEYDFCRRVNVQGLRKDMHFEILFVDTIPIGLSNYAIDLGGIKGVIEPGFGYIMEFYIEDSFRGQGWGRKCYEHIEEVMKREGAKGLYLTPFSTNEQHLWMNFNFVDSKKVDPDNHLPIFIKMLK